MPTESFRPHVLLRSEDSGGAVSLIESSAGVDFAGPPLHFHDFDEAFYVLEGELTFQLGSSLAQAGPGAFVFAPRRSHHTLANLSRAPARYLLVCTPAGFERYFARIEAEQAGIHAPAETYQPVPQVTRVGPQIGEREDLDAAAPIAVDRGKINVLLRSEQSEGEIALMDNLVPADVKGPPLHHHDFDEAFYVLEGELTFQLGDELFTRRRGELAFARRGVHHTFANLSGADARTLIVCTPAGFERYFDWMAARAAGVEPPPEALERWPEVIVVGPRIGE